MKVEDAIKAEVDPFDFSSGLYSCGSKNGLKSLKAGAQCSTYKDCPSN